MSSPSHGVSGQATTVSHQLVEDALEHLWDYAYLGRHSLSSHVGMPDSSDGSRVSHVERGKALSLLLQDAIKRLRPQHDVDRLSRERRYFDILHCCYVEGERNDAVARKLDIAERTFYRHRRQAIEVITQMLDDLNGEARQA